MNEFINSVWDEYKDDLNIVVGKTDFDLIINPTKDSHLSMCRIEECTIANIVTDAIKEADILSVLFYLVIQLKIIYIKVI